MQPQAQLEHIAEEDKPILREKIRKKISRATALYLPAVILAIASLIVINAGELNFQNDSFQGIMNVFLVIGGALAARLYAAELMDLNKDLKSWEKKIIRGTVHEKTGNKIHIASHVIALDAHLAEKVNKGDNVEVQLSIKTETVIRLKKFTA